MNNLEKGFPFVAATEWPDDIKGLKWGSFNVLHFLNTPIWNCTEHEHPSKPDSGPNAMYAYKVLVKTLQA